MLKAENSGDTVNKVARNHWLVVSLLVLFVFPLIITPSIVEPNITSPPHSSLTVPNPPPPYGPFAPVGQYNGSSNPTTVLATYNKMPKSLKREWVDLIYRDIDHVDLQFFDRLINILKDPSLDLPHRDKSKKSLMRLKGIAETMGQLEEKTNTVLRQVLNGYDEATISHVLNRKTIQTPI